MCNVNNCLRRGRKYNNIWICASAKFFTLFLPIPFLAFFGNTLGTAIEEPRVKTYPINTEKGQPSRFACTVENGSYPCLETISICTSKGGKMAGFCFYHGEIEGMCCLGVALNDSVFITATTTQPTVTTKKRPATPDPVFEYLGPSMKPIRHHKTRKKQNSTENVTQKTTTQKTHDDYDTFSEESLAAKYKMSSTSNVTKFITTVPPKPVTTPVLNIPLTNGTLSSFLPTVAPPPLATVTPTYPTKFFPGLNTSSFVIPPEPDVTPPSTTPSDEQFTVLNISASSTPAMESASDFSASSTFSPESMRVTTTEASTDNPFTIDPALMPTITMERITLTEMKVSSHPLGNVTIVSQSINSTITSSNSSSQSYDFTNKHLNFTSKTFPNLTILMDSMNLTTQMFNMSLTNATQHQSNETLLTDSHLPANTTIEDMIPEVEKYTAADTLEVPSLEPRPIVAVASLNRPLFGSCQSKSYERQSLFRNPLYPKLDTEASVYVHTVVPLPNFCALRVEILESLLAGKGVEGCIVDSVVIVNAAHNLTLPQCGFLHDYQFTVKQDPDKPVKIVVTTQSPYHLWSINLTQIPCSNIKSYREFEFYDCGLTNPKEVAIQNLEEPKIIHPIQLLRSSRKALGDIFISDSYIVPTRLLQNAVVNLDIQEPIVRGEETGINEFPWQALLMIYGRPLCGASIINEYWIVTAAHCVYLPLRLPLIFALTVNIGDHDLRTTQETPNLVLRVVKIIPHVQYDGIRNDIALIKVASKIPMGKTIWPVCLPEDPDDNYALHIGITTGWGRTGDSVISPVLRATSVPILSNAECIQHWESLLGETASLMLDSSIMCAGGGNVGTCNGDGGGPLVVQEDDGRYRLVGLASYGFLRSCAISGVPVVYTRLTAFLDWIALNLSDEL